MIVFQQVYQNWRLKDPLNTHSKKKDSKSPSGCTYVELIVCLVVFRSPVTTGTSVIAFEYDNGILMGADTLASYGSLARYRDVPRLHKVNKDVVIGCMGDYADYQWLLAIIEQME